MGKLEVDVTHFPEQLNDAGRYTIRQYLQPQTLQYGSAVTLILTNEKNEERTLFVSYAAQVSDNTNLGRLVNAFGKDPDHWIDRKIDVTMDEKGRRRVEPVVK